MSGVNLTDWARAVQERLNERVKHVQEIVDQKLEYQQKFLEQRLDSLTQAQSEKLLTFNERLEESMQEIRGYKDILQQQLVVLDSTTKKAHVKISELLVEQEKAQTELQKYTEKLEQHDKAFSKLQEEVDKILKNDLVEEVRKDAMRNDPMRRFFNENGRKVLVFILTGLALYLLRNVDKLLIFFQQGAH